MRFGFRLVLGCFVLLSAATALAQGKLVDVVEFYHAAFDHYFISASPAEIQALDNGTQVGWKRTGLSFKAYDAPTDGTSPVCRFYIPPDTGNSHFYSASPAECAEVRTKFPGLVYESPDVMYVGLPDAATGSCQGGWKPVYRMWNKRADSNHRYTTDSGVRAEMLTKGFVAEGYGTEGVAMCAPSVPPVFQNITWVESSNYVQLEHAEIYTYFKTLATVDLDGNGIPEILIPPVGDGSAPRSPLDPDFVRIEVAPNGVLTRLPSPVRPKYVAGGVGDILVGNFDSDQDTEVVFIDSGREETGKTYSEWERSAIWMLDKQSDGTYAIAYKTAPATPKFWHSSNNPMDINGDGVLDFVVASLDDTYTALFLSSRSGHRMITVSSRPSMGTAAMLRLASGKVGIVEMPYGINQYNTDVNGKVYAVGVDGAITHITSFDSYTCGKYKVEDGRGYSSAKIVDWNGDGLDDIIGTAEAVVGDGKSQAFVLFLQQANGSFVCANELVGLPIPYSLPNALTSGRWDRELQQKVDTYDVNGDGAADLVLWPQNIPRSVVGSGIFLRGEGGAAWETSIADMIVWNASFPPNAIFNYQRVIPADFNGDGIADFILVGSLFDSARVAADNQYGIYHRISVLLSHRH